MWGSSHTSGKSKKRSLDVIIFAEGNAFWAEIDIALKPSILMQMEVFSAKTINRRDRKEHLSKGCERSKFPKAWHTSGFNKS